MDSRSALKTYVIGLHADLDAVTSACMVAHHLNKSMDVHPAQIEFRFIPQGVWMVDANGGDVLPVKGQPFTSRGDAVFFYVDCGGLDALFNHHDGSASSAAAKVNQVINFLNLYPDWKYLVDAANLEDTGELGGRWASIAALIDGHVAYYEDRDQDVNTNELMHHVWWMVRSLVANGRRYVDASRVPIIHVEHISHPVPDSSPVIQIETLPDCDFKLALIWAPERLGGKLRGRAIEAGAHLIVSIVSDRGHLGILPGVVGDLWTVPDLVEDIRMAEARARSVRIERDQATAIEDVLGWFLHVVTPTRVRKGQSEIRPYAANLLCGSKKARLTAEQRSQIPIDDLILICRRNLFLYVAPKKAERKR